jgi:hypothetical protein
MADALLYPDGLPAILSRMSRIIFLVAALALAALPVSGAEARALKVAVFDIELVYTSTPDVQPTDAEAARLAMLSSHLREALDASPKIEVVDITPVRDKAAHTNLQSCAACNRRFAEEVGADVSATTVVHKVSELIMSVTVFMRSAKTGEIMGAFTTDFRGNTDDSWRRALDWLIENKILPEETPK